MMFRNFVSAFIALMVCSSPARASDACSTTAIKTIADVVVSDGTKYKTETYFHTRAESTFRQIKNGTRLSVSVEGPASWTSDNEKIALGTDFHKLFSLGHQFHAFILHFSEINDDIRPSPNIEFQGESHSATTGRYPYGGLVHLIEGNDKDKPVGLKFEFPDTPAVTVKFGDWRKIDGLWLPFRLILNDGNRDFEYNYTEIETRRQSPMWYFETIESPDLDIVDIYRLHRKLLAAHCMGDADMIADLTTETSIVVSNGMINRPTRDETRSVFKKLFQRLDYKKYTDLTEPIIEFSGEDKLGWIVAQVRAEGEEITSGRGFDDQWGWIMLVQKIDGQWQHSGNGSNRAM